jgi:hypothetical protein
MSFYGDDINRFFFGTVVNNNDADLFLGRVQIRVYGLHGEGVSNSDLPWAQTMLPSTEPGMGGVGSAPMISNGAQVFGLFLDGKNSQIPLVLGTIPKIMVPTTDQSNAYTGNVGSGGDGVDPGLRSAAYKSSGTAIVPGSLEGSTNAEKVYRFLISKGFTPEQACGIIGNFAAESGVNIDPKANNPDDKGEQSFGIAQWRAGKYDRLNIGLKAYAASTGQDYTTLECQLGFLMYELQTTEKKANAKIRAAKTVEEAAIAFDEHFERSDGSARGKRIGYAQDAYRRFVA